MYTGKEEKMGVQTSAEPETTAVINKKERFKNVDFLRFLFAIEILLFHFGANRSSLGYLLKDESSIIQNIYNHCIHGFICVDFFFIIAGFFLFKNLNISQSTLNFAKNKIIRLLPIIWFSMIIYAIFSLFIDKMNFDLNNNMLSIFLLNSIGFSSHSGMGNTHQAWFVAALFWVSLFYFYIHKIFDKKYLNLFIWLIIICSYGFILNCNYPYFAGAKSNSFYFINQGVVRALAGVGLGYFIVMLYNCDFLKNLNKIGRFVISGLEIYLTCFLIYYICISTKIPAGNHFLYILTFTILFYLFLIRQGVLSKIFDNKLSSILGSWSYSIFIMHIIVFDIIRGTIVYPHKEFVLAHPIFIFSSGIMIAVIVGILTYYFFEKPITKYLKNKFLTKQALAVQK